MNRMAWVAAPAVLPLGACAEKPAPPSPPAPSSAGASAYLDYSRRDDVLSGGVRMIPINTPRGMFHVWTKRVGNNPKMARLRLPSSPPAQRVATSSLYFGR
jgi:proline iminopeptidase